MSTLPILKKNAYLTLLIKDNHIFANLAYTDFSAQKTYMLSDTVDLSPLKFRMDDIVFNKAFWSEYFDSLEKNFEWNFVDRNWQGVFKVKDFDDEGVGVNGVKVLIDDNQPFFNRIYLSLKDFSKDIALRVVDDLFMRNLLEGLRTRLGYTDLIWTDLDLSHFTVYRAKEKTSSSGIFSKEKVLGSEFLVSKTNWSSEIALIDSVKNSKLEAFLSIESSSDEVLNKWANFVVNTPDYISDPIIEDILRSFLTIQNLSIKENNREKFESMGRKNSAIVITGKLPKLIKRRELLLSIIDGFELEGIFDIFVDPEHRIVSYGRNLVLASDSDEIMVIKGDVLPCASKLLIPEINQSKGRNKILFSGKIVSQDFEQREIYALNPNFEIFSIPKVLNKVIIEGELKNGAVFTHFPSTEISFISTHGGLRYDSLVVDCRIRPVVYGPRPRDNKDKLQTWNNGNKE